MKVEKTFDIDDTGSGDLKCRLLKRKGKQNWFNAMGSAQYTILSIRISIFDADC